MDSTYWQELYRPVFAGRRWIIAPDAAAGARRLVDTLRDLGAGPFLVIAGTAGTGDPPDPEVTETIVLDTGGTTFMESFRRFFAALTELPADAVARVDEWDPDRTARVIQPFMPRDVDVAGRRLYGARPREWMMFEDKIAVEALWDAAGVARAPSEVVPARRAELAAAAARLDDGLGTVWVADNRDGWHGGAEYVRRVRDDAAAADAAAFFALCSDEVRVMPYLEGIPCGIHAVVCPDGIAVFRPVEMIVLQRSGSPHFEYAGGATYWEAPEDDARAMRETVRRVAEHLRDTAGYRGAFGIDGVLTADGFFPTELNPRYTGGLSLQASELDEFAMALLNMMLVEGEPAEYRPAELEAAILGASSARRGGWALMKVPAAAPDETRSQPVAFVDGEARAVDDPDQADAPLQFGPAGVGGLVLCFLEAEALPVGPPAAPAVVSLFRLAAELWDEVDASGLEAATARIPPGT